MTAPRNLSPRAWRPVRIELEGRLFFMHADGKVYEKRGKNGTMHRIKDQLTILRVHQRFREIQDAKAQDRVRVHQLIGRLKQKPRDEPPDAA